MDFSRPDNARKINRLKVLSALRKAPQSKADLSRELHINKVSIGEMTDAMIAEGLLEESGKDKSSPGRPGTILSIKRTAGRVFSIEVGKKAVSVAISDTVGRILRSERFPKDGNASDEIMRLVARLSGEERIYGAAVVLHDKDAALPEFPFPVQVIPPAIAEAEAEMARNGRLDNFLFVSWSASFDAAIMAGELRHLPHFAHIKAQRDAICSCGGKGCLEAAASADRLLSVSGAETIKELLTDRRYEDTIKSALRPLAAAIAEGVQALSASSVMLTGRMSQMDDKLFAYLQNLISSLLPPSRSDVIIYRSSSGERGAREGAALIALDAFFYHSELLRKLAAIENVSDYQI